MNARKTRVLTALATSLALALPMTANAAFDAFLKIDGVEGESTDDQHKGEIVIEAWSFGATQTLAAGGGARATGKSCLSEFRLVKLVDKASPALLSATMTGVHLPTATISVRKAGDSKQDYLIIKMSDVLVTSVQHSGGGYVPMESLSLNFAQVKLTYHQQKPDGSLGAPVESTASGRC
jgi:type VI secretion system secreted protein Hcp